MCSLHLHEIADEVTFPSRLSISKGHNTNKNVISAQTGEEDTTLRLRVLNLLQET